MLRGDIGRVDAMKIFMSALCRQIKNNLYLDGAEARGDRDKHGQYRYEGA